MLKVVHDADAPNENGTAGGSLPDETLLTVLGQCWRRRCRPRLPPTSTPIWVRSTRMGVGWVRNGYHGEREVLTAAGAVPVRA